MNIFLSRYRLTWISRCTAIVLLFTQFLTSNQIVYAQTASLIQSSLATPPVPPAPQNVPPPIKPIGITKELSIPPSKLSALASTICGMHLFSEPLLPDGPTKPDEDQVLWMGLKAFKANPTRAGLSGLEEFLRKYPHSVWSGSVEADLGFYYNQHGYYSRAVSAWQNAWALMKTSSTPAIHSLADRVVTDLLTLLGSLGRLETIEPLFKELKSRNINGCFLESLRAAHESHWMMKHIPGTSFKCGPYALQSILKFLKPHDGVPADIEKAQSTPRGFSLDRVAALAKKVNLDYQPARRTPGAAIPTPAVIHWKSGHYAAVLKQVPGGYLVKDPTFGPLTVTLPSDAIDDESDGYFLVKNGQLPSGWSSVSETEAGTVFGRGSTNKGNAGDTTPHAPRCIPCEAAAAAEASGMLGMPSYNIISMPVSLTLNDTPVGYNPPVGPSAYFSLNVNQYEASQPATFTYFNQGPLAVNTWTSYVIGSAGDAFLTVNIGGGGFESCTTYTPTTSFPGYQGYYAPDPQSQAVMWVTTAGKFERRLPDGSKQLYTLVNGLNTFMTSMVDPQGNALTFTYTTLHTSDTFNGDLQLTSVTDAVGQQTTLTYGLAADPLKITKVTSLPTGRTAIFGYQGTPLALTTLTDEIGLTSSIGYDTTGNIISLNTPYGTTSFIQYNPSAGTDDAEEILSLQITNPIGQQEFVMRRLDGVGFEPADPVVPTVSGYIFENQYLSDRNTFYWDRHAIDVMRNTPGLQFPTGAAAKDLSTYFLNNFAVSGGLIIPSLPEGDATTTPYAHVFHWFHQDYSTVSSILECEKYPLENIIWYGYAGNSGSFFSPANAEPTVIARVLDNGQTQATQHTYNSVGNVTQTIDPLGRTTNFVYDSTGVDLQQVTQQNGSHQDVLLTQTYVYPPTNSYPAHRPQSITDASGQVTSYTYNPQGQVTSVTDPKSEITSFNYAGLNGSGSGNYLKSISSPTPPNAPAPITTLQYDLAGRINTTIDPQGHTTTRTFDNLDRPLVTTRTDGKTQTNTYQRLDLSSQTDWNGKVTNYLYDSIEQLISVFSPNGGVTSYTWCTCGGMGSLTDPNGHTTTWSRDLDGRVIGKTYPDGTELNYTYENTTNRLKSTTDANGTVTSYTYNNDDSIEQTVYSPASGIAATPTETYIYDSVYPRPVSMTTTGGTGGSCLGTTTYAYNPVVGGTILGQGRLASVSFSPASGSAYTLSPTTQFTYDALGRILSSNVGSVGTNTTSLSYDTLGRVFTISNILGSTGISFYSNTGRIGSVTLPNGVTSSYVYADQGGGPTALPLLTNITNSNGTGAVISKFDYLYDANNRITQWTQQADAASPTHWNYNYDSIGQLLSAVKSNSSNANLLQYSYAYDLAGNRISQQVSSGSANAVTSTNYNSVNQVQAQSPGGSVLWKGQSGSALYSVTLNGQPAQIDSTQTNFVASIPVAPGNNSVQVIAEDTHANLSTNNYSVNGITGNTLQTPVYNKNGDTIIDSAGNTYTYDAKGETVEIAYKMGGNSKFTYYGENRVGITESTGSVKQFVFSGLAISEEYDGTNVAQPAKRFFGQGFIQYSGANNSVATPYFYTRDHLGSTRELSNSNGTVITRLDYDPYGVSSVVSGTIVPDFEYAGYYSHAPSGLYLTNYRFYSATLGRWLSRDPIAESGGINLYAYCGNNPICCIDPLGLETEFTALTGLDDSYRQDALMGAEGTLAVSTAIAGFLALGGAEAAYAAYLYIQNNAYWIAPLAAGLANGIYSPSGGIESSPIGGSSDCVAQTAQKLAKSLGAQLNTDPLFEGAANQSIIGLSGALRAIESNSNMVVGGASRLGSADPGVYAVFDGNHVMFAEVTSEGTAVFDSESGEWLSAEAVQYLRSAPAYKFVLGEN